jgi:GH15 family glucan-1,4-alpha-glucosidase
MARHVVLGNNGLTVGLNEHGLVHDFYYPYVGLENLTTARNNPHYVGIWIDGTFSWLSDDGWKRHIDFHDDALIGSSILVNDHLKIQLHLEDFVDVHHDIFARKVHVKNLSDTKREVRLFFHQGFQISANGRADTAMYVPEGNYILDYKGSCSILAYAETAEGEVFDQYAVGNTGIEGKEGTFRDAEDGELSGAAVEHASVDSTIRVSMTIPAEASRTTHYWLAVNDSQDKLEVMHELMIGRGFDRRMHATVQHWQDWLKKADDQLVDVSASHRKAVKKSLMIINAHTDKHGGIIAAADSSIYNYGRDYYSYVWPRDGAFVIWPLIRLGYTHEAKRFFNFCRNIIHEDGYMMHKYQPDQAIGSTWHPLVHDKRKELAIQEDETAIIIFMLSEYLQYSHDYVFVKEMYESLIKPAADFMTNFIDADTGLPHASYDLWEEKFSTSTYTAAVTCKALSVASAIAKGLDNEEDSKKWKDASESIAAHGIALYDDERQAFVKGFLLKQDGSKEYDKTLDVSSMYGAHIFDSFTDEAHTSNTMKAIEKDLLDISPSGGTARYENDGYFKSDPAYKGNPWFVTTLWVAQYYAHTGQKDKTAKYVEWALKNALPSGVLSEQINPETSEIVGVTPLVWSHAELINTILDFNN